MASDGRSPYVGPRPFERTADDRARFFGRDREVEEIVSLILSHPVVLVYAQSGAGKTSLFNTAVSEALERKHVELLPLTRVRGAAAPGLDAASIANLYVFSALESLAPDAEREELAGLSLAAYLERTRPEGDPSSQIARALVLDQFEELFTSEVVYELYGDGWQEQQRGFFVQVADAIEADPLLRVVLVMRKEYLAELERYTALLPERLQTRFHLEPLGRDAALAAVRRPLEGTGRSFADGVAEALVDRLLAMRVGPERDVHGRFVEPVQLQLVCRSLWQELPAEATAITEADVQAFGDVDAVLGQFYDGAVRAAASAARTRERTLRARIERDFITSIGTRGTVYLSREWSRRSAALDELERRHVIHAEWRSGTRWYELAHDRLIDPIRRSNERFRRRLARRRASAAAVAVGLLGGAVGVLLASTGGNGGVTVVALQGAAESLAQQGTASGLLRETLTHGDPIVAAVTLGDSTRVATVTDSGAVVVARLRFGTGSRFEAGGDVRAAAFTPDGRLAVLAYGNGTVSEWQLATGRKVVEAPKRLPDAPTAIALAPDGRFAAVAAGDVVTLLRLTTLDAVVQRSFRADVTSLAFTPDGGRVAAGLATGLVALAPFRGPIRYFVGGPSPVGAVALDPDGKRLLAGSNATARLWRVADGKLLEAIPVGSGPIQSAGFSPDGQQVVTAGRDFLAYVWRWLPFLGLDLTKTDQIERFQRRHGIAADGIVGPKTRGVVQQLGSMSVLVGNARAVTAASFAPYGNTVVTGGADGTTRVWGYFAGGATVRERIVQAALLGAADAAEIGFRRYRPMLGVSLKIRPPTVPSSEDSSSFVTWCYWQAGAPDPNGLGYNGNGFTGTILAHMRRIPKSAVRPGDLVVWTPPGTGRHVAIVVAGGPDPDLVSHWSEVGPTELPFSSEEVAQQAAGSGTPIWLTEDLGP